MSDTALDQISLPEIDATDRDIARVSSQAWGIIMQQNQEDPILFRRSGELVWIETGDHGEPVIETLDVDRLRHLLARIIVWTSPAKGGPIGVAPPTPVVRDMLADPDPPVPVLERVVDVPVFSASGEIITEAGYNRASRLYYRPSPGLDIPEVSEEPSGEEIGQARELILTEVLGDFPFVSDSERAHAVAAFLLPYARELIPSYTPLHLITAPAPGSGKSLLADALSYPFLGEDPPAITEAMDQDEWRKRITAALAEGPSIILLDNLQQRLASAHLAAVLTRSTWRDRILGGSRMVNMPVRCLWLGTGNNTQLSTELARRTVRIRLDPKMDRPWLRPETGFRHPNLREWMRANRGLLVWAALTLIRSWLKKGRPRGPRSLGSYEDWSRTMGGILEAAGISGFLGNVLESYEEADQEGQMWREFFQEWWNTYRDQEVEMPQLFSLAMERDLMLEVMGDKSERSQKTRLGKALRANRDRQVHRWRLQQGLSNGHTKSSRFRLVDVGLPYDQEDDEEEEVF